VQAGQATRTAEQARIGPCLGQRALTSQAPNDFGRSASWSRGLGGSDGAAQVVHASRTTVPVLPHCHHALSHLGGVIVRIEKRSFKVAMNSSFPPMLGVQGL
jgi:hypothetical protein